MPPLATWETQARVASVLPGLEEAAAVTHPVNANAGETDTREEIREERCGEQEIDEPCFRQIRHLLPFLEADIL
jgi:hypothetical protein